MLSPVGFWSYARHDDSQSEGRLSQLRAIVGKEMNLKSGAEVTLWQDIAAIPFGADWERTIKQTIGQTTFFVPIVTPRFLKSKYCHDEFVEFRNRMLAIGRDDILFPVHYVDVDYMPAAETVFGEDLAVLRRQQWIDFRPLLYADPKSSEVRKWAGSLADSILGAMRRVEPAKKAAISLAVADPAMEKRAESAMPARVEAEREAPTQRREEAEQLEKERVEAAKRAAAEERRTAEPEALAPQLNEQRGLEQADRGRLEAEAAEQRGADAETAPNRASAAGSDGARGSRFGATIKRIGYVLYCAVVGVVCFAVGGGILLVGAHFLKGGAATNEMAQRLGAATGRLALGGGGALGALFGAWVGAEESKTDAERAANVPGWIAAGLLAALFLSTFFQA